MMQDVAAEKAVLASLYKHGREQYIDLCDIIQQTTSFTVGYNQIFYACLQHIYEKLGAENADIASIYTASRDLNLESITGSDNFRRHIEQTIVFGVNQENARKLAVRVRKLAVARVIQEQVELAKKNIESVTGNESVSELFAKAEDPILDLGKLITGQESEISEIKNVIDAYVDDKINNPVDQIGVSSGFPLWDFALGGGLRPGSINVVAARMKKGKSALALNMSKNILELDLPVLYMDTEMQLEEEQIPRLLANLSSVKVKQIETGQFGKNITEKNRVIEAAKKIKSYNFSHICIRDMSMEQQMSLMRRWLYKVPGMNKSGRANPCVIVYDYIKNMDMNALNNLKEYQVIGFLTSSLHNFATKYNVPFLTFVQLNRQGIDREETDAISQSDRIAWFASNVSLFKEKNEEEMEFDGSANYKLMPLVLRHGAGLNWGDYINVQFDKSIMRIYEKKLKSQVIAEAAQDDDIDEPVNF